MGSPKNDAITVHAREWLQKRWCEPHPNEGHVKMLAEYAAALSGAQEGDAQAWECAAAKQGTAGGNDPADCDHPYCGCDPNAQQVPEVRNGNLGDINNNRSVTGDSTYSCGYMDAAEVAWEDLCNKDDRTSPEEYSNMCLITRDELAEYILEAALARQQAQAGDGSKRETVEETIRENSAMYQSWLNDRNAQAGDGLEPVDTRKTKRSINTIVAYLTERDEAFGTATDDEERKESARGILTALLKLPFTEAEQVFERAWESEKRFTAKLALEAKEAAATIADLQRQVEQLEANLATLQMHLEATEILNKRDAIADLQRQIGELRADRDFWHGEFYNEIGKRVAAEQSLAALASGGMNGQA